MDHFRDIAPGRQLQLLDSVEPAKFTAHLDAVASMELTEGSSLLRIVDCARLDEDPVGPEGGCGGRSIRRADVEPAEYSERDRQAEDSRPSWRF
jgi:hypothetical protein